MTPTDDFVGGLKQTNRELLWMMAALALVEGVLIYFLARRMSQPIRIVSEAIQSIRRLAFPEHLPTGSRIHEIAQLQRATTLLDNALRSFAVFVPVGLVRRLIDSGKPLQPEVEPRFMTVMFSDVEGFTTLAEQLTPAELTEQTSRYFESVTAAVAEEQGTIDKFIGDSVMAFWGAPAALDDHAFHACRAALRARHRMARLNAEWTETGRKPMRVRIGVHCGDVMVGNVGSSQRLSYTVMGDGVNIASRIEGLNKQFGTTICISDAVLAQVGDQSSRARSSSCRCAAEVAGSWFTSCWASSAATIRSSPPARPMPGCPSLRPRPGRRWPTGRPPRPSDATRRCWRSSRTIRWRAACSLWPGASRTRPRRRGTSRSIMSSGARHPCRLARSNHERNWRLASVQKNTPTHAGRSRAAGAPSPAGPVHRSARSRPGRSGRCSPG